MQRVIDAFGRGPDQPFPEPVPYMIGDRSLTETRKESSVRTFQGCKLLLRCQDEFYKLFLTRAIEGLELVPAQHRLPPPFAFEKFATEVAAFKPDLLIWFDNYGHSRWDYTRQSLVRLGIRLLVLVPTANILRATTPGEGENDVPRHRLPMPKGRLIKVIEDILAGR